MKVAEVVCLILFLGAVGISTTRENSLRESTLEDQANTHAGMHAGTEAILEAETVSYSRKPQQPSAPVCSDKLPTQPAPRFTTIGSTFPGFPGVFPPVRPVSAIRVAGS